MKLKRILGLSAIALTSLAFVSCGGDSGEKEAPNTIKYVDLEGQEQELVVEKTNNLNDTKNAAKTLKTVAFANEEFNRIKESYTSVTLEEDVYTKYEIFMGQSGISMTTTITTDQDNTRIVNLEQKKIKLDSSADMKIKVKGSAYGESYSETVKGKNSAISYSQFYDNNAISIVDGKASAAGQSQTIKYYTDSNIKFEDYEFYDFFNLDKLFVDMFESADLKAISSTTKSSITFQFTYSFDDEYITNALGNDSDTLALLNNGLFDSLFKNINVDVTVDTKTFLPSKISTSISGKVDLKNFYNTQYSYSVTNAYMNLKMDASYKLEYGNETINKVVDTTGYTKK